MAGPRQRPANLWQALRDRSVAVKVAMAIGVVALLAGVVMTAALRPSRGPHRARAPLVHRAVFVARDARFG